MLEFTRLKNAYLKMLCRTKMPADQRCVFDTIMRHTWGYRAEKANISLSTFEEYTKIRKQHIIRAINGLIKRGIISASTAFKDLSGKKMEIVREYSINSFLKWDKKDCG